MSYEWNNSNNNDLPPVTRTSIASTASTVSSSVPVNHIITASIPPPPPPTSSPLSSMRYQHSGGEISSHQIMSHQADRIIPHGHSGKKKKGIQLSRWSSAEVNEIQQNHQPSSSEQDSGTTSIVHQQPIEDPPRIQDLETQLDFLKGECSTIDIILASLRNAFLRDGTDAFRNTSSFLPLAASSFSSFSSFSLSSLSSVPSSIPALAPPTPTSASSSSSSSSVALTVSSLQQQSQRKADMEKEMRAGYDDLMLQVRQLEKKVESLENKIQQQRNFRH